MIKKKNKKIIIITVIIALLLGGAGAAVYLTVFKKSSNDNNNNNNKNNNDNIYSSINSSPYGALNEDGYSRGYVLPPNADAIIAALYPYTPAAPLVAELPGDVDWRTNSNVVGPVRTQGGCGSCWAFVAVDNMAMAYGMRYGKQIQLSPQQLVDCDINQGGCAGGWPTTAWTKYFKVNNHAWSLTESQYPYYLANAVSGQKRGTCTAQEELGPIMVTASTNVQWSQTWSQQAENNVMAYVTQNGPVTVAINADNWGYYKGGIATTESLKCSQSVNHATMIVGFGSENGQNYWIVRNQWGTSWGEGGYIRLARGSNTCCILCYVMSVQVQTTIVPTSPPVVNLGSILNNGMSLSVGQELSSTDSTKKLKLQTDGNLVLYSFGQSVWATNTRGTMSALKMQNDCNLVLYDNQNIKVWSSLLGLFGQSCTQSYLILQNNGNMAIYNNNNYLWSTNTFDATSPPTIQVSTTQPPTNTPTTQLPINATDAPTTQPPIATTNAPPITSNIPTVPKPVTKISIASIGCWGDARELRALPVLLSVSSNSKLSDCAWLAYKGNHKYFGLSYGGECWGGDGSTYNKYGQSNNCNMPCVGSPSEICGGAWALSTYQILITSSSNNVNTPTDFIDPNDNNIFELIKPPDAFDLPGQCKYYKSTPSFCWKCIDNVHKKIACQDVTSTSTVSDSKNLFVAQQLCPDLSLSNLTARQICS